jgi:hypothetical protein
MCANGTVRDAQDGRRILDASAHPVSRVLIGQSPAVCSLGLYECQVYGAFFWTSLYVHMKQIFGIQRQICNWSFETRKVNVAGATFYTGKPEASV